jgi:hypothetical protein
MPNNLFGMKIPCHDPPSSKSDKQIPQISHRPILSVVEIVIISSRGGKTFKVLVVAFHHSVVHRAKPITKAKMVTESLKK